MVLSSAIREVLSLQPAYSSANTDEMQRRGRLIRRTIPDALRQIRGDLLAASGIEPRDLLIEGRDGTGLKSEVPWVRIASRIASPSATTGWYIVLLHRGDGSGVYLALGHGSTQFNNGALIARSDEELSLLMSWARSILGPEQLTNPRMVMDVRLMTKGPLAASYEKSCVVAFYYDATYLPDDAALRDDIISMARLLGRIYDADRLGQAPLSQDPDVRDAELAVSSISRPTTKGGQGFALNAAERRAIEMRAMTVAITHLQSLGYSVRDVSSSESFDLEANRQHEVVRVEVKGSTGPADAILLTFNEVQLHKNSYPANALIVVHSINLNRQGDEPNAFGGTLKMWLPWSLADDRLRAVTFTYHLD